MVGHSPSGLRKDKTPSELAHNSSIKTVLMAGAQEALEAQLVLLTAQVERLTARDERLTAQNEHLTAQNERLSREIQQLNRKNEQLLAAVRSAGMTAQKNAATNSAAAAANFPWYLPVMQMGCHAQASFAHRIFGV